MILGFQFENIFLNLYVFLRNTRYHKYLYALCSIDNFIYFAGVRKYQCDKCDKAFGHHADLKRHISGVHEGVKKFQCDKCDKAYADLRDLNSHIAVIHEGIKQFKCDKCDYGCGLLSYLKVSYFLAKVHCSSSSSKQQFFLFFFRST